MVVSSNHGVASKGRACLPVVCLWVFLLCWAVSSPLAGQSIHIAALQGDVEGVREALDAGASPDEYNLSGFAPIHSAARNNNTALVALLLQRGGNVDIVSDTTDRHTALHIAVINSVQETIVVLLQRGASCVIKDNDGGTALSEGARVNDQQIIALLNDGCSGVGGSVLDRMTVSLLGTTLIHVPLSSLLPNEVLLFYVGLQALYSLTPWYALGIESGLAVRPIPFSETESAADDLVFLTARIVNDLTLPLSFTLQLYAGADIVFAASGETGVFFEGGARLAFTTNRFTPTSDDASQWSGEIFIEVAYVLPFVAVPVNSSVSGSTPILRYSNAFSFGLGYRFKFQP